MAPSCRHYITASSHHHPTTISVLAFLIQPPCPKLPIIRNERLLNRLTALNTLLPILIAGVIGSWAFLSLIGGERTRRAMQAEAEAAAEAKAAAEPKVPHIGGGRPANHSTPNAIS